MLNGGNLVDDWLCSALLGTLSLSDYVLSFGIFKGPHSKLHQESNGLSFGIVKGPHSELHQGSNGLSFAWPTQTPHHELHQNRWAFCPVCTYSLAIHKSQGGFANVQEMEDDMQEQMQQQQAKRRAAGKQKSSNKRQKQVGVGSSLANVFY